MKKSELVTLVAEKAASKKDTEKTIDTVFTAIADIMAAGDKLQISGFSTFLLRPRSAQHARDTIRVPARRSILQRLLCRCSSRAKF